MKTFLLQRLIRFSPLVALLCFVLLMGHRMERLPVWARWAIFLYVALSIIMPVLFSHRSREELARSKYASVIQARTVWTVMLFLYILSFIAGLITLVLFREAIPLQYAIIALGVNLLLILLFSRALFGTSESKPKN
jgi:hypothetical protein